MSVPIIDIGSVSLLAQEGTVKEADYNSVGGELYRAFSEVGFAYLKNSGIEPGSVDAVQNVFHKFFDLDTETKNKFNFSEKTVGYFGIGTENVNPHVHDYKEVFNVNSKLENTPTMCPGTHVKGFYDETQKFMGICRNLSHRLLVALAHGMQAKDKNYLLDRHKNINKPGNHTTLRSTLYPKPGDDVTSRMGTHTDYLTFTLIFQDASKGLQAANQRGEFVDINPVEGAVFMNIGDLMSVFSNGRLVPTVHRVVNPSDAANHNKVRSSLAYYVGSDDDAPIEVMEVEDGADPPRPDRMIFNPADGAKTSIDWCLQKFQSTF